MLSIVGLGLVPGRAPLTVTVLAGSAGILPATGREPETRVAETAALPGRTVRRGTRPCPTSKKQLGWTLQ